MTDKQNIMLESAMNCIFIIFLFSQIFFNHTVISQISAVLMSTITLYLCLVKRKLYLGGYFIVTIFFVIQSYLSSVKGISINSQTSMKMTITLMLNFVIALSIYNYILIYDNLEKSMYYFARVVLIFTVFIAIMSYKDLLSMRLGSNISFNILGNNVKYNSNDIALLSGFSYLIFLYEYSESKRKVILISMAWVILISLLTGSRKGLVLIILGSVSLIYMLNPDNKMKNIIYSILIMIILYILVMNVPIFYNIIGSRVEAYLKIFLGIDSGEASAQTRTLYIDLGLKYFKDKPWLGYGLDCFRHLPGSYGTYSHNNYIELLVSGGILSFIWYYLIRVIVVINLFIKRNNEKICKLVFVMLCGLFIVEYGLVDYFERIFIVLFIFPLCMHKKFKIDKRNI